MGATQARRGGWLELLAVVAVLLGMIGGFGAVTAAPADAAECSSQGTFDLHRLLVEFGGSDDGTLDGTAYLDTDVDGWCYDGNDIIFTGYTPALHISCSEDLTEVTMSGPDGDAVITEFWLDSRNQNNNPNRGLCQDESTFPEPTCEDTQAAECTVPVTLEKLDETDSALAGASFLLDGDTDYTCTSDALGLCDFGDVAPGDYTLSETDAPDGYHLLDLSQLVPVVYVEGESGAQSIELGPFVNSPVTCVDTEDCPVPVTLQKLDENEAPLAGASFLLDGDTDYTCTSDALGVCDFGDVAVGDYTLSETAAPDGYEALVLTTEQQNVSVAFGPESIELGPFVNTPIPPPPPQAPAIDLVKTAVVGDGAGDGDLVTDPETGLPTLSFSSGSPGDQTAVYEYTITNTGPVTLFNVTLTDDRLGTILDESQGVTLAPGESTTERATETFTIEDASGGIDNIITNAAVTTGVDSEDTEVSATDDAVIQLTAQQSSILINLDKIAVVGEGDVEDVDGAPTVTWQEAELDANEAKTIRYRFTITNIGPSTLYDIELTDDMLSDAPLIPATDGLTIEPGGSEVIEVDHTVTPEDVFPDDPDVVGGQIQGDLLNTASVRGSNEARDAFDEDADDAAVLVRAPRAEVLAADVLPATGFGAGGLVPLSLLLLWLGAAVIWLTDRPQPLRY